MSLISYQGLVGLVVTLALAVGCTPRRNTLRPYPDDVAAERERKATALCRARRAELPPNRFTTDGCSMWPDDSWVDCCVTHDMAYWCGGPSEARREADRAFCRCVSATMGSGWARVMFWGVRIGGPGWMPAPWRWGYGWPWLRDG